MQLTDIERGIESCEGGVTAASGFLATGLHCGIKKGKLDLAVIYSSVPATTAAVFTKNKVIAAPLVVDQRQLKSSSGIRVIVINSGNANACTGERGLNDAVAMVESAANAFKVARREVLISSTGIIGKFMPIESVCAGIQQSAQTLAPSGSKMAAEAIRTTDTFSKEAAVSVPLADGIVKIGGIAKGSGMIAPNMATMLAFVTTDAAIEPALLQKAWSQATDRSFNRISVDGDMSTNDMAVVLANGMAGTHVLYSEGDPDYRAFIMGLEQVLVRLSKMIVLDGEGATKFVEIRVAGAQSEQEAVQAARAIANSNLVKTAIHGEDANWGRILAAVGCSGIEFQPELVEISFGNLPILRQQFAIEFSEERAKEILSQKEICITVDLNQGTHEACFWTCDLSKAYVDINANYRT